MSNNLNQGASIEAASLDSYSPEDRAFYEFWYGHMLEDLMQPPLIGIAHSTARYIWDAARSTPAATTGAAPITPPLVYPYDKSVAGDGELPPPDAYEPNGREPTAYKASSVARIVAAAIEADRAQQAGAAAPSVKTWQERYNEMGKGPSLNDKSVAMMAEIADLRAQLAAKGQGEPVGYMRLLEDGTKMGITFDKLEEPLIEGWKQVPVFAAPASAQPADPLAAVRALAEKWNQDAIKDGFAGSEPAFELLEVLEAGAQPDQRESAAVKCIDWAALGYKVGATVEQDSGKSWASRGVITCVHPTGALDVEVDGKLYGWSARFCTVVAAPAAQPVAKEDS